MTWGNVIHFLAMWLMKVRESMLLCGFVSSSMLEGREIDESKRVSASLWFCKFKHVRREGNRLAHALTKRTILSVDMDVWVKSLPSELEDVFQSDLP